MSDQQIHDPLNFMRNMWGNMGFTLPGMVAPTFDVEELDKRIKDMKAVEGWLRMNLSMLQMTIQGLEMQRSTVGAVQAMGQMAADAAKSMTSESGETPAASPAAAQAPGFAGPAGGPLPDSAMWPWQMMQQMREQMEHNVEAAQAAAAAAAAQQTPATAKARQPAAKK